MLSNDISAARLHKYLMSMTILDMIMVPKDDAWLRLITIYPLDNGYKYIIDNGGGNHLTIFIIANRAFIKGFDHENELNQYACDNWDETFFEHIYHGVPDEFLSLMESDEYEEVTFCMWFDDGWHENIVVDNDGGKSYLLSYICSDAVKWCKWACDYYERDFNVADVAKIYHGELSADLIKAVNPDCQVDEVIEEINLNRC